MTISSSIYNPLGKRRGRPSAGCSLGSARRSQLEIGRPVLLPSHGQRVFRNLPAVAGSNEVIRVITAHVPRRLARLEVPRLHVAHTDGLVTVHLDVIVGQKILGDGEAAGNACDLLRKLVGAEFSQGELVGRGAQVNLDFIGEDITEELPIT